MGVIDDLLANYERFVSLPWREDLAGSQRVWMAVYRPDQERRLRARLADFHAVTKRAGHEWVPVDVTDTFADWMDTQEYKEEYFADPEALGPAIDDYAEFVAARIRHSLEDDQIDENTVVAVVGVGSLFPFARVSHVLDLVSAAVRGRVLVFFPGEFENNAYRLLDARDGWNYLAVPITASKE
ncbi:MAG: BREX protein BrxB domain-containing protein [Actinomycetota bacterium]